MILPSHESTKSMVDAAGWLGTAFVALSHFAAIATPILTLFIAILTIAWWVRRWAAILRNH